jgi:hypothetical protein
MGPMMTNNLKIRRSGRSLNQHLITDICMKTRILIVFLAVVFGMGDITVSRAGDDNDIATITDIALVRPGCFLATVLGSAIFVVALPFAAASGSVRTTANTLVLAPADATFTRPLGDFNSLQ